MIQILAGEKGQGKTKKLIDMANEASKTVDGNVVFIDDDSRHMYDLHYGIRFVETSKYKICSYEVLIGFIYGILSQNGDIQKVFIDGLGNIAVSYTHLHLRRIYMNIVSNAVKYTPAKGSVTLCTREIKISQNRSEYEFICYDTGIGMSKEFQKHMFEPFTQENSDVRTSYKGTGLGLAITKSLVEKMGGSISVSSEKGRGTTFSVKIPFEINKNAKEDDNSLQTAQESDLIKGVKVLLVEDNDLNMEIAEFILERCV